jgi:hypothetical protein
MLKMIRHTPEVESRIVEITEVATHHKVIYGLPTV